MGHGPFGGDDFGEGRTPEIDNRLELMEVRVRQLTQELAAATARAGSERDMQYRAECDRVEQWQRELKTAVVAWRGLETAEQESLLKGMVSAGALGADWWTIERAVALLRAFAKAAP